MSHPTGQESLDYERYVDGLRRSNAKMLTALKDLILWAERHGLTKADLITGGQAEVPVITNARAAIAEVKERTIGGHPPKKLVTSMQADICGLAFDDTDDPDKAGFPRIVDASPQPKPATSPKTITVHVEGGLVADVTGIPEGYELRVEDHDGDDTSHPAWDAEKRCFVTIYGGEAA